MEFASSLQAGYAGDFQAFMIGWSGRVDPDGNTWQLLHAGGTFNYGHWSNPAADALLDQARDRRLTPRTLPAAASGRTAAVSLDADRGAHGSAGPGRPHPSWTCREETVARPGLKDAGPSHSAFVQRRPTTAFPSGCTGSARRLASLAFPAPIGAQRIRLAAPHSAAGARSAAPPG